jgi:hypothetical protein
MHVERAWRRVVYACVTTLLCTVRQCTGYEIVTEKGLIRGERIQVAANGLAPIVQVRVTTCFPLHVM